MNLYLIFNIEFNFYGHTLTFKCILLANFDISKYTFHRFSVHINPHSIFYSCRKINHFITITSTLSECYCVKIKVQQKNKKIILS